MVGWLHGLQNYIIILREKLVNSKKIKKINIICEAEKD